MKPLAVFAAAYCAAIVEAARLKSLMRKCESASDPDDEGLPQYDFCWRREVAEPELPFGERMLPEDQWCDACRWNRDNVIPQRRLNRDAIRRGKAALLRAYRRDQRLLVQEAVLCE